MADIKQMTPGEYFLELEFAEMYPQHPTRHGKMRNMSIGPSDDFVKKHYELARRINTGIGHIVNPAIVDESQTAQAELLELGLDPKVFMQAYGYAESTVASVTGW